jgi:hypothetical protein
MTRQIRSRRAGLSRDQAKQRPLYARLLGLQYLSPTGFLCFVFLEGTIALGVLLALAELVSWWGVLVLPLSVAGMVKLNDVIAGAITRTPPAGGRPATAARRAPGVRQGPPVRQGFPVRDPRTIARATVTPPGIAQAPTVIRRAAVRPATMDGRMPSAMPAAGAIDAATAMNGHPVAQQWGVRAEQLDAPQHVARQSAARRYE